MPSPFARLPKLLINTSLPCLDKKCKKDLKVAQEVAQIQDTVNFRIFFQVFRVLSGVWLRCRQLVLSLMSIYM